MERWRIELELEQIAENARYDLANNSDVITDRELLDATLDRLEELRAQVLAADEITEPDLPPTAWDRLSPMAGLTLVFVVAVVAAVVYKAPWAVFGILASFPVLGACILLVDREDAKLRAAAAKPDTASAGTPM